MCAVYVCSLPTHFMSIQWIVFMQENGSKAKKTRETRKMSRTHSHFAFTLARSRSRAFAFIIKCHISEIQFLDDLFILAFRVWDSIKAVMILYSTHTRRATETRHIWLTLVFKSNNVAMPFGFSAVLISSWSVCSFIWSFVFCPFFPLSLPLSLALSRSFSLVCVSFFSGLNFFATMYQC